jgi:iron complex outermembrane receptor protein
VPQAGEASTDRVFVTGSAIPTAQEVGPNPVLTATREAIERSGDRTAEQFLRNLPVANANSIPLSNNNNGSDTAIGAAGVALRAFDARATLVLIDGRRVAPYPITNSGISFVDLFSIPRDAIESIEILKDGASTTYGADAVAGVVNIKLRKIIAGPRSTSSMATRRRRIRASSQLRSSSERAMTGRTSPACSTIITATRSPIAIATTPPCRRSSARTRVRIICS